ncbi:MAG: hypothetical protein ACNI28_04470 [Arcobacter sp.]|uniref:hypothetical protein n=1 Tax=Arcobacter sp. TaxID=1872629 RepID=UPI003B00BEA2
MIYLSIKLIHIFSVFIYGGFLFTDNLFLSKIKKDLSEKEHSKVREYFMQYVRKVVPKALLVAVASGIYLFYVNFGAIGEDGLSNFQILLGIKAILGLWLGIRGILQVFFSIQPLVFKSHIFPFILVVIIIFLSQIMFSV